MEQNGETNKKGSFFVAEGEDMCVKCFISQSFSNELKTLKLCEKLKGAVKFNQNTNKLEVFALDGSIKILKDA